MLKLHSHMNPKQRILCFLVGLILQVGFSACIAQRLSELSTPVVRYIEGEVIITYDIQSQNSDDLFNVWIVIKDANNNPLDARSLEGDVGVEVRPGADKKIIWRPDADEIVLGEGISVQVFTELVESKLSIEPAQKVSESDKVKVLPVVAQSLLFPGLGLSRITGQPHWIRGVAGYCAIGSSVALTISARNNYDLYTEENDPLVRDELFDNAVTQDNISEILAYTAVAIWVGDIIWNIVGISKLNASYAHGNTGFSVKPAFEPISQLPLLAFTYRF